MPSHLTVLSQLKNSWKSLTHFLFGQGHQEQLGYYRFFLSSILFYIACFRQFNITLLAL